MTSQDVVDSLNHHYGEKSSSAASGILTGVDNVKADGPNKVVVNLKGGDADFPFILSDYHILICPSNGDGSIDWQSGIGTGGYVLKDHEPGIRSLTTRNPNYWKEGRAHFDEVESLGLEDPSARTTALRTDEVDCIQKVELKVARIVTAELVDGADKLLQLTLDVGDHERQVFSGIREAYDPADLVGKLTVVVANLAPRKMRFGVSEGMVLAAGPGGRDIFLLSPDTGAQPGMDVS